MEREQLSHITRWASGFFNLLVLRGKTDEGQSEIDGRRGKEKDQCWMEW